jgi:hypothetical protein
MSTTLTITTVQSNDPTNMSKTEKAQLKTILKLIKEWNNNDIRGYDDITPSMDMLESRRELIQEATTLVSKIRTTK